MKQIILVGTLFLVPSITLAVSHVVQQTGKTFVKGISDEKARSIAKKRTKIKDLQIKTLKIRKGDEVEFRNNDTVKHHVFVPNKFSHLQDQGTSHKHKFEEPGTYQVRCAIHPKMKLTVEVK